jgi:hypothetical protein
MAIFQAKSVELPLSINRHQLVDEPTNGFLCSCATQTGKKLHAFLFEC